MNENLYSYEGLLILIDCLNELIDTSGKRKQIIDVSKDKLIESYEVAKNFMPVSRTQAIKSDAHKTQVTLTTIEVVFPIKAIMGYRDEYVHRAVFIHSSGCPSEHPEQRL